MKSNELMIGDWVLFNGNSKKVTSLLVTDLGIDQIYVFGKSCQVATINEYIEPIPLTAEILEKNGWKYENYANEYSTEGEEYFVYEDFDIYINNDGKFQITSMDTININLDYVHQLQHALKLCGINKTIEL